MKGTVSTPRRPIKNDDIVDANKKVKPDRTWQLDGT
jgi:hypothetical protein